MWGFRWGKSKCSLDHKEIVPQSLKHFVSNNEFLFLVLDLGFLQSWYLGLCVYLACIRIWVGFLTCQVSLIADLATFLGLCIFQPLKVLSSLDIFEFPYVKFSGRFPYHHPKQDAACVKQSGGSCFFAPVFPFISIYFGLLTFLAVFLIIISSTRQSGGSWFLLLSFLLRPTSSGLDKCGWTVGASQNPDLFQLFPEKRRK